MGQTQSSSNDSTSPSTVDQSCPPTHDPYNVDPQGPYEKNGPMGGAGSPDFPPSDGYRWRKYGQKSVKGSAFARNYYKCTYPGCTVKKQVEKMTSNGKLVDHVSYKGDHTHDPPQITRLNAPDQQTFRNSVITESLAHTEHISKHDEDRGVPHHQPLALMPPPSVYEGMHHVPPPALYNPHQPHQAHQSHQHSPHQQHQVQSHQSHQSHSHQTHQSHSHQPEKDVHHLPPHQSPLPSPYAPVHPHQMVPYSPPSLHPVPPPPPPTSSAASPRLVIETNTDVDHLDDGYHWRKYGQKTVKGSPYPRSYYKCTEKGCSVKKQVEQNGTSIVNTYEGTHTHLAPGLDETTSDGKRRRPRRTKDSLELAVVPKKRMPDEILEREQDNGEHRLMPSDQQKRIRMQSMVDEITNHERSGNPSALDVSHQSHLHSNGAPVLPLTINRQLMEPVPSSSLLNLHQQMGHHNGLPNYYQPPAIYPPASHHTPQHHTPQGGRLSHSIELMGGPLHHHDQHHPSQHHHDQLHHDHHDQHDHHQLHPVDHHQHHHDHHSDMFTPFTLPPPTLPPRNHTNL